MDAIRFRILNTLILLLAGFFVFVPLHAQITQTSGAISGSITDPTGAVVRGASVTIISNDTNQTRAITTDSAGYYTSGSLNPGTYKVTVAAPGFSKTQSEVVVQVGVLSNGNLKLTVGAEAVVIEVTAGGVQLTPDQANVQSVITTQQIENLPVNGRNFLDLAQLEPGVQLQSGETFDPTKAGYSALSFSGASGRTTRILLDGQDITDETVGTTIFNVSAGAIDEFQLTRSSADVSSEIGSTGQVLVSTRSGSNAFHGLLFYNFQDHSVGFARSQGQDPPFQRNQFGGSIGGPILKDKLFFFGNIERLKQDAGSASSPTALFQGIANQFPTIPQNSRETYSTARLDYSAFHGIHLFARANYDVNAFQGNFQDSYSVYANRDNTPGLAYGADFITGRFTHSLRGSYEKFHNLISDASSTGTYNPLKGQVEFFVSGQNLFSGPNFLAPQATYQSDKQIRYDGSWIKGAHNIRYGASVNRILGGGFASFFGIAPRIRLRLSTFVSGDPGDPLNYHANQAILGNGQGFFTETPSFGAPAGGQGDWRIHFYVGDSWKVRPNFTVTYGVGYQRDTGRTDSDLAPIPCSAIDQAIFAGFTPCTGSTPILDSFGPGLGRKVHQPNANFGPQLGLAYAVTPKTVLRSSIGVYYENSVFNNVLFDRPFKLAQGRFFANQIICGGTNQFTLPDGTVVNSFNGVSIADICNQPLRTSAAAFAGLQKQYQAASAAGGPAANGSFLGETLNTFQSNSFFAFAPNYRTPYSTQFNVGVQQQLWKGAVITADYIHQVTVKIGQSVDVNHVGAARFLNTAAAQNAIAATLVAFNATTIDGAIANGATINDFAAKGLDSGNVFLNGNPAAANGLTPNTGAAFPGANPLLGNGYFQAPIGRAGYNALQVSFREQEAHPLPGFVNTNLEISYALSKFTTTVGDAANSTTSSDGFFSAPSWDFDHPTNFNGYGSLDHRHIFSAGGSADLKYGPRIGLIAHYSSPTPSSLTLDDPNTSIFQTDLTGDGTTADLANVQPGAYQRSINGGNLKSFISNFNTTQAGKLTPAGQALVSSGLFTAAQLTALGGVVQQVTAPPNQAIQNQPFRSIDASFVYPIRLHWLSEVAELTPGVAMYNVGNFGNFKNPLGVLQGAANFVNGPNDFATKNSNRILRGSGTFDQGGPRSTEFQLKFTF